MLLRATRVTPDAAATPFTYVAVPNVESVSLGACGLLGGCTLVITGSGFDPAVVNNVVTAAGAPCIITAASQEQLTCTVGAAPLTPAVFATGSGVNASFTPGGRGLERRVWSMSSSIPWSYTEAWSTSGALPFVTETEAQLAVGISEVGTLDFYLQSLRGYFLPPVTANYSFLVRADDFARVYLSTNASAAGERLIAAQPSWCPDFLCVPDQLSAPVALTAGKPYWFRVMHQELGGLDYV